MANDENLGPQDLVQKISDADLLTLLRDDGDLLQSRLQGIPGDVIDTYSDTTSSCDSAKLELFSGELSTADAVIETAGLPGIRLNFKRKGNHNDSNSSRLETPYGSRNFGYRFKGHPIGDLLRKGKYSIKVKVRRPIWVGIGKVTFHSRVELYFNPRIWSPGGVAWWGECWGWYGIGFSESTLCEWRLGLNLS